MAKQMDRKRVQPDRDKPDEDRHRQNWIQMDAVCLPAKLRIHLQNTSTQSMILIEVNNRNAKSNFDLISSTQDWIKNAMPEAVDNCCIILNPHLEGDIKITHHDHGETNNAPLGTNTPNSYTDSDNTIRRS